MKQRLLILNEEVMAAIKKVKSHAHANVFDLEAVFKMMGTDRACGDDPRFRMEIPDGYRVVYSVEEQPIGLCAHMSFSLREEDKNCMPHEEAVELIMQAFGINKRKPEDWVAMWIEDIPYGNGKAVNIMIDLAKDAEGETKGEIHPLVFEESELIHHCPVCKSRHDMVTGVSNKEGIKIKPRPGNVTICLICEEILIFDDSMTMQRPTLEQMMKIQANKEQWAVVEAAQKAVKQLKQRKENKDE